MASPWMACPRQIFRRSALQGQSWRHQQAPEQTTARVLTAHPPLIFRRLELPRHNPPSRQQTPNPQHQRRPRAPRVRQGDSPSSEPTVPLHGAAWEGDERQENGPTPATGAGFLGSPDDLFNCTNRPCRSPLPFGAVVKRVLKPKRQKSEVPTIHAQTGRFRKPLISLVVSLNVRFRTDRLVTPTRVDG